MSRNCYVSQSKSGCKIRVGDGFENKVPEIFRSCDDCDDLDRRDRTVSPVLMVSVSCWSTC